jgi:hypothetical protein
MADQLRERHAGCMSIATHTQPSQPPAATPAPQLTRLTATLEQVACDIASTAPETGSIRDLRCAIRHLEGACENLAAATTSMAFAATADTTTRARTATDVKPAAKAASWRLHHLSHALAVSRDACRAVAEVAEAFDASMHDLPDANTPTTV